MEIDRTLRLEYRHLRRGPLRRRHNHPSPDHRDVPLDLVFRRLPPPPSPPPDPSPSTLEPSRALISRALEEAEADAAAWSQFECRICRDVATSPVVTPCGHLFCWPCLYLACHILPSSSATAAGECPACGAAPAPGLGVVPLYGCGGDDGDGCRPSWSEDFGVVIPPRPEARRTRSRR